MSKEIIINADMAEEIRIAIVENGRLADLDIETQSRTKHKGNIYKGIVSNIEDSLDAAFVEFGEGKQAFLKTAGDGKHDILLGEPIDSAGPGILAAVSGVQNDPDSPARRGNRCSASGSLCFDGLSTSG